jgi:hypothetical protein
VAVRTKRLEDIAAEQNAQKEERNRLTGILADVSAPPTFILKFKGKNLLLFCLQLRKQQHELKQTDNSAQAEVHAARQGLTSSTNKTTFQVLSF